MSEEVKLTKDMKSSKKLAQDRCGGLYMEAKFKLLLSHLTDRTIFSKDVKTGEETTVPSKELFTRNPTPPPGLFGRGT